MSEYFIQNLFIKDVRGIIKDLEIPLSDKERKHLIITGKNGSGKTSLLNEVDILLNKLINNQFAIMKELENNIKNYKQSIKQFNKNIQSHQKQISILEAQKNSSNTQQIVNNIKSYNQNILTAKNNIKNYELSIKSREKQIKNFSNIDLVFSNQSDIYENIVNGKFILAFFKAKRENKSNPVSNPTKQIFRQKYSTKEELNKTLLQYLVNLKTSQAFAQIEGNTKEVEKIKKWFDRFENALKDIFDKDDLKIDFNHKNFNFKIEYDNRSFDLNELSDGYSSFLAIFTELILRMEAHNVEAYNMQGVVLIDEIETHLHIKLQKKVLPFLVSFFPKIQFIVTSHSPFVLSSLSNAIICDLEKRFITSDLSIYSYDALIESYFDSDKYSQEIKDKLSKFEELSKKDNFTDKEKEQFKDFKRFFKDLPKFMANELAVKVNEILLNSLGK